MVILIKFANFAAKQSIMKEDIIGRKSEIKRLEKLCKSKKSEFITIYGRRRVGKTFLVTSLFEKQLSFFASGIIDGDKEDQMSSIKLNGDLVRCSTKR